MSAAQGGLRAVHVIAGLSATHGGPFYSVPRLCEALEFAGMDASLFSVAIEPTTSHSPQSTRYRDFRFPWDYAHWPVLRGLRCSSALSVAVESAAKGADIVHDHGIWLLPNVIAGRTAARFGKPFIVSPRGMLAPEALAFSRLKKQMFWYLLQETPVRRAACLHATSDQEHREIRAFGLGNPVAVIPNGIDLPDGAGLGTPGAERVVLALGRIHPKKGLDVLVRAWAQIAADRGDWRLRIIGPAELDHDAELQSLALSLGATGLTIEGPMYGDAKTAALRDADLFVLPTRNENFGLTVAEALAAGTPVIATKGAPWSALEVEGCGWWIDHGVEHLATALSHTMAMPRETLKAMGAKGRAWMARDFSWDRVAKDMMAVYRWLARGEDPPAVVRFG